MRCSRAAEKRFSENRPLAPRDAAPGRRANGRPSGGVDLNLFLNGGGTRLAAHLGALEAIQQQGGCIAAWSGASAGSLVAAVLAAGFTHEQAVDLMLETDYRQFLDLRPLRMIRDFGLCSGRAFETWLDRVLGGARFRSLDVPFSVVTTDIATGEPFVFSSHTTAEEKVATAVRCSIGIPGVFGVRRMGQRTLVDGTLTPVQIADLFPKPDLPSFLIRLRQDHAARLPRRERFGLAGYVRRIMEIMLRAADDLCTPDRWTHDLCLKVGSHSPIRFGITPKEKRELYHHGYEQCRAYLKRRLQTARAAPRGMEDGGWMMEEDATDPPTTAPPEPVTADV